MSNSHITNQVTDMAEPPICTCALSQNYGVHDYVHDYACPLTQKCQIEVQHTDWLTGRQEVRICGSRMEPEYAMHLPGCPNCAPLCEHCGSRTDRFGYHSINCPYQFINEREQNRYYDISNVIRVQPPRPLQPPQPLQPFKGIHVQICETGIPVQHDAICSICFDNLNQQQESLDSGPDQSVLVKPDQCTHFFHYSCLNGWFLSGCTNDEKCPECRTKITSIHQFRKN